MTSCWEKKCFSAAEKWHNMVLKYVNQYCPCSMTKMNWDNKNKHFTYCAYSSNFMGTGKKVFNKCQLNSWWHSPCILEAAQKTSASSWALYGWERIALCPLPVFSPLSLLPLAALHVFRHRSCGYCKIRTPHPLVTYLHLHFPNTSWDTTLIFCCFPRRENVKV